MAIEITVPRLGWSMDEGIFVGWLKGEGDAVEEGDLLFELEGDKAKQEVESFDNGILRLPPDAPEPGDPVQVGQCLGFLCGNDEPTPRRCSPDPNASDEPQPPEPPTQTAPESSSTSGPNRTAPPSSRDKIRIPVSPRAAARAVELGVDLNAVQGTGRDGRIRERDVLASAEGRLLPKPQPASPTRRQIAARMLEGAHEGAPVTLITKADATELVRIRQEGKASGIPMLPSLTAMFIRLVAKALESHRDLLSQWAKEGIRQVEEIHLATAVDTPEGLLAPVLRDSNTLPLDALSTVLQDLIERARSGDLAPRELHGGTFTVTNLGAYPVDGFTPILNPPQSAILGIGRIQSAPAARDGALVIREEVTLSLTFDHRVHDGAKASQFLATLTGLIDQPRVALDSERTEALS